MANITPLTAGQDILTGTEDPDNFFGSNLNLNGGDRLDGRGPSATLGGSTANYDRFFYTADASLGAVNRTFSSFVLVGIESFEVTNDTGGILTFDLSSSIDTTRPAGVRQGDIVELAVSNSTSSVVFDQVADLTDIRVSRTTGVATTNVDVRFQDDAVVGASTVQLTLDRTNANTIRIGSVTTPNAGIETLNLIGGNSGVSQIATLDTNLTQLNLSSVAGVAGGSIVITNALNTTVRTINSSATGSVTLSFANNAAGQNVVYTSSSLASNTSADTITGGAGDDTISTFGGNDTIDAGAGNDTVNGGDGADTIAGGTGNNTLNGDDGNDTITATGTNDTITGGAGNDLINVTGVTGFATITAGDGNDEIVGAGAVDFSAGVGFDSLNAGAGRDYLTVNAGLTDGQFSQASNLEELGLSTAGTTTLGLTAQGAGIDTVRFVSGAGANDVVNAGTTTRGFAYVASTGNTGDDTVTAGSGNDVFVLVGTNQLTNADNLQGGTGTDSLILAGTNTLTAGGTNGFSGVEFVSLLSNRFQADVNVAGGATLLNRTAAPAGGNFATATAGGNVYSLTLTNGNAPTASGVLSINGGNLAADTDGAGALTAETVNIVATGVTTYRLDLITGAANDVIFGSEGNDVIFTGAGDDQITANGGNDTLNGGLGNDVYTLVSGNNTVTDDGGIDQVTLGTGNDNVNTGTAADTVIANANLTGADTLDGGDSRNVLAISGKNYVDADFAGTQRFTSLRIDDVGFTTTLGVNAERLGGVGIDEVRTTVAGVNTINAATYTRGLFVDLFGTGNKSATTGAGSDIIRTSTGTQTYVTNGGNDVVQTKNAEFDATDTYTGGAGDDFLDLDNTGTTPGVTGGVTAGVNLNLVTGVEIFRLTGSGDRIGGFPDADVNTITFTNGNVTTATDLIVDTRALTDTLDTVNVVIDVTVADPDYRFVVQGNAVSTTLNKLNVGVNNNIQFEGGTGVDTLRINGGDLGSTTLFGGGAGRDVIVQSGGLITDDSYRGVREVEVLAGEAGSPVNASLGAQAALSGLNTVTGTVGNDQLLLDAAFTSALAISLGGGAGVDTVNGGASAAVLTISATDAEVTAADTLVAGTTGSDSLVLTATNGTADLAGARNIETITVVGDSNALISTDTTIGIGAAYTVNNTANVLTINATAFDVQDDLTLFAGAAVVNIDVLAGAGFDNVTTGTGNDNIAAGEGNNIVNAGGGNNFIVSGTGADQIRTDAGTDRIFSGDGSDRISAGLGNDTINAGGGDDFVRGDVAGFADLIGGIDTIDLGAGNDQVRGGLGADVITGGAGIDTFFYASIQESRLASVGLPAEGRDTITDFTSGTDRVDATGVAGALGGTIRFVGNADNFGDAQSLTVNGDAFLDAVFQRTGTNAAGQTTGILFFDINNDGALNSNDLQINLVLAAGQTGLVAADVLGGAAVGAANLTAFEANFAAAPFI